MTAAARRSAGRRGEFHFVAGDNLDPVDLRNGGSFAELGSGRIGHEYPLSVPADRVAAQRKDLKPEIPLQDFGRIARQSEIKGVAVVKIVDEQPAVEREPRNIPDIMDAKDSDFERRRGVQEA